MPVYVRANGGACLLIGRPLVGERHPPVNERATLTKHPEGRWPSGTTATRAMYAPRPLAPS